MSLFNFHGKWKEIESKNDSEFLKSVGVSKTKRRIAKRMKIKCKWDVQDETCFIYTNKLMGVEEKTILDEVRETKSTTFGQVKQISTLDDQGCLCSEITVLVSDGNMDVPVGTLLKNKISVNKKLDRLTIETTHVSEEHGDVTLTKILKKRKVSDEDEAAEELADLKAMQEAENEE